jgi:hypothetical protein
VEPALPSLPKLKSFRNYSIAAPVPRTNYLSLTYASLQRDIGVVDNLSRGSDFTLLRYRGAELRTPRPRREIGIGLTLRNLLASSLYSNLAFERGPIEEKGDTWVRLDLSPLRAMVVGVNYEAPTIERLEKDHPDGGLKVAPNGSQRTRVRLLLLGYHRRVKPSSKLLERVGGNALFE